MLLVYFLFGIGREIVELSVGEEFHEADKFSILEFDLHDIRVAIHEGCS